MKLKIVRLYQLPINREEKQKTIGEMYLIKGSFMIETFYVLELPWVNNKRKISCIPEGIYKCEKRYTQRFGNHFKVKNVEGRSYILIHIGNKSRDTLGCILPGMNLNYDKNRQVEWVGQSTKAMKILNKQLPDQFDLEIEWRQ